MIIEIRSTSSVSPDVLFDRARSVRWHTASMTDSEEAVVGQDPNALLELNDEVTWRARHFGIWWSMTARMIKVDRPFEFVDEQVRGPFAYFRHTHTFAEEAGRAVMVDLVEFRAPLGVLGRTLERLGLAWYLRRMLTHRAEYLGSFGSSTP